MNKLFKMEIQKGQCKCRDWNFFVGLDKTTKPVEDKKNRLYHDCEDLTVYQNRMTFYYIRKNI